ncbi:MAG: hypothetical protein ACM3X6_02790 [Patescibacteria group bacterium]
MESHLLPGVKPKLFGKYRGIVAVGKDPKGKGRIKVKIPALFGFKVVDTWAYPVLPPQLIAYDIDQTGKLRFEWESTNGQDVSIGPNAPASCTAPWTLSGDSMSVGEGQSVRKKLAQIIPVEPASWEIPAGTGVWVEFEGGDPDKPIWTGFWR